MEGEKEKKRGTQKQLQEGKRCCKVTKYIMGRRRKTFTIIIHSLGLAIVK